MGQGSLPGGDGWVGLYFADTAPLLLPEPSEITMTPLHEQILEILSGGGALFFRELSNRVAAAALGDAVPPLSGPDAASARRARILGRATGARSRDPSARRRGSHPRTRHRTSRLETRRRIPCAGTPSGVSHPAVRRRVAHPRARHRMSGLETRRRIPRPGTPHGVSHLGTQRRTTRRWRRPCGTLSGPAGSPATRSPRFARRWAPGGPPTGHRRPGAAARCCRREAARRP